MKVYKKRRPDPGRWIRFRILLVGAALALGLGIVMARAVQLQVLHRGELSEKAASQYKRAVQKSPRRGTIYDANNQELAVSVEVSSICAYPKRIRSPKKSASVLARALKLPPAAVRKRLDSKKNFVWIKRKVTPKEAAAVKRLKMAGVDFVTETRRFYPMKTLAAQVLGFCGTDGRGLEGLEYYYDPFLSGREDQWMVFRDALGRPFKTVSASPVVQDGYNLILTIDKTIEDIAERALCETVERFSAKSAVAVVMEPKTGAVLAVAHVPRFNPNSFKHYEPWIRRNRAITDTFEPGSTFKVFLGAAALESGHVRPDSLFDCEQGTYRVGANVIHDVHAYGALSFEDVLKFSSNIGAAKIGAAIGAESFYETLKAFGFGSKTGIDCPGESPGCLTRPERWSDMDALAVCFGQGVSVTALQLAAAVGAAANGGVLMRPYLVQAMMDANGRLVKSVQPTKVRRVMSLKTARNLVRMLERVVGKGGTGQKAALSGYRVAGKTGTAQKTDPATRRYARDKHVAAFVGFVPSRDPALAIVVVVDEPRKSPYGGVVAAPAFRRIAGECLQYLKVPPELVVPQQEVPSIKASKEEQWAG